MFFKLKKPFIHKIKEKSIDIENFNVIENIENFQ
jgi:hypothetical protein